MNEKKFAVILFNIGGPEISSNQNIKQYLMNFFSDKMIIRKSFLLRKLIAFIISRSRYQKTKMIYDSIGGKSTVPKNTKAQANSLKHKLGEQFDFFYSMRYWNPFSFEIIEQMKNKNYDQIILLPLYPQCSSTTTVSAYIDWIENTKKIMNENDSKEFFKKTKLICKHFDNQKYIDAMSNLIINKCEEAIKTIQESKLKIFFSAHSIPEFLVTQKGDPYKDQIEKTVKLIMNEIEKKYNIDYIITYQSKVGKLKWLEPNTEDELIKNAKNNITPIIVPIAFVSENSETLYELDIEYKEVLKNNGITNFFRVPTLDCNNLYIELLCDLIKNAVSSETQFTTKRTCDNKNTDCPCIKYEYIQ